MPMPPTRVFPVRLVCLGLMVCFGLASCSKTQAVAVSGIDPQTNAPDTKEPWPAVPPRIDVSNFNGRVDVIVSDHLCCPRVEATAWSCDDAPKEELGQVQVAATLISDPAGGPVFRVVSTRPQGACERTGVDLMIRVPSAGAITVYNRGGPVKIVDAPAAVQVENGRLVPGEDGDDDEQRPWIQVRSKASIDQPVALVTDSGDVVLLVGPGSRGLLDIQAPRGEAHARARVGTCDQVQSGLHQVTARYNSGTNPVLLRTEDGDATAMMLERPEDYKQPMW
jgi:hypothetical protein